MSLLSVKNLSVTFGTGDNPFRAVDRLSYDVNAGEVLGIVGESGSGKSVSSLALMGLIDFPGKVTADKLEFEQKDLIAMKEKARRKITGDDIAMIFQDPMTALNPCFTVGNQIMEAIAVHQGGSKKERKAKAIELLTQVGIPAPEERIKAYPHQLSGGMSQRVMIAMAIACDPKLLIADEPTTALDVTIQAQIIDLLLDLQRQKNMGLILITHDLALVSEATDRVVVMYAGQVVETGPAAEIFANPQHPYTEALMKSLPESASGKARLDALAGVVPGANDRPDGCLLNPRCPYVMDQCREQEPDLIATDNRAVRCFKPLVKQEEAA